MTFNYEEKINNNIIVCAVSNWLFLCSEAKVCL